VVPVSSPPIASGEVVIEDGIVTAVREATGAAPDAIDLGDAVLIPGLVNAHTHLDYTVMRGLLEEVEFFPWIRELNARKAALDRDDWIVSATWGAAEAVAGGVTTLADCCDSGAALDGALALGMRGIVYQEVFGIDEARKVEAIVDELAAKVRGLQSAAEGSLVQVGISPHAPYTVRPSLFRALADYARESGLPLCIHAAESRAEGELLRSGIGPIAEMFARRGITWEPPGGSTVQYLDSLGMVGESTLLVHGVQVSAADRHTMEARGAAWVHCPKSNAKLGNGVAPLGLMLHVCGRVGLGSDSVASNNTMDLFEEMRFAVLMQRGAQRKIAALTAPDVFEMATLGGARALGLQESIGSLEVGKRGDVCAVAVDALHSVPAYDPVSALVYAGNARDVVLTVIEGQIRYDATTGARATERFRGIDMKSVRARMSRAADKMRNWRPTTA
jgi:5-methylthioadenosine/S-adenosylhomocysteine deaminase